MLTKPAAAFPWSLGPPTPSGSSALWPDHQVLLTLPQLNSSHFRLPAWSVACRSRLSESGVARSRSCGCPEYQDGLEMPLSLTAASRLVPRGVLDATSGSSAGSYAALPIETPSCALPRAFHRSSSPRLRCHPPEETLDDTHGSCSPLSDPKACLHSVQAQPDAWASFCRHRRDTWRSLAQWSRTARDNVVDCFDY